MSNPSVGAPSATRPSPPRGPPTEAEQLRHALILCGVPDTRDAAYNNHELVLALVDAGINEFTTGICLLSNDDIADLKVPSAFDQNGNDTEHPSSLRNVQFHIDRNITGIDQMGKSMLL